MKFISYGEIDNLYTHKLLEEVKLNGLDDPSIKYACYRKIDGANFQISIDENNETSFASRSQTIGQDSNFMNYKSVVERDNIEEKLKSIRSIIVSKQINDETLNKWLEGKDLSKIGITMFGEICGGLYRHQDVERDKTAVRIQGRIDYSPSNQWIPFDLMIRYEDKYMYANQDTLAKLCKQVGLLCQIEEFRGTLDECINFPVEFNDDTGHRFWGLPIIENNTAEGVVIKPIETLWVRSKRVIFKNKTTKFKERIRETKKSSLEVGGDLKELEKKWFEILKEYMNESRVMSAVSKVGAEDFATLNNEAVNDALKDFKKDNEEELNTVFRTNDPKDFRFDLIIKIFRKFSGPIVREVFLKNR